MADRKAGVKHVDHTHHSLKKKTVGEKLPKVNEGVLKFVKSIGRKKTSKKATMDATTDKLHDWRQKNSKEQQDREKYVSPFRPIVKEGDVHSGQGEKIQKRTKKWMDKKGQSGAPGLNAMNARTAEHKAKRGVKKEEVVTERLGGKGYKARTDSRGIKVSGDWEDSDRGAGNKAKKRAGGKVEKKSPTYKAHVLHKEDKAFNFVLDKIRKEVGKDGYVSKNNPRKKQTDAEKAKVRAHNAKLAKQDGRDETEKASDGRYSDRHSNRGSD